MRLTKNAIAALPLRESDYFVWDDSLPGFGVRIRPSGTKVYVLQYRNRFQRTKRLLLGRVGEITLDEARRAAGQEKGRISLGTDPARQRDDERQSELLRDLAQRYLDHHCTGRCKPSTLAAHAWLLNKFILPHFGAQRIKEITVQDVARLHQRLADTPYNANRVLGLLRAMFNKAEEWGLLPPASNPAATIRPFTEFQRQRFLTEAEFERLFSAIDDLEYLRVIGTYQTAAVRLLALTGCRLGEILELEWDRVDLIRRQLVIERHKTDKRGAKIIPLNAAAADILDVLPHAPGNPYVIAGKDDQGHLVNLQKPWQRIIRHAELPGLRLHDLRHSFASFAVSAGLSLPLIGGLLGHGSPQSTARYAHLAAGPLRDATERVAEMIPVTSRTERSCK
jgi:integrase